MCAFSRACLINSVILKSKMKKVRIMCEKKSELSVPEIKILEKEIGVGNQTLYKLCSGDNALNKLTDYDVLAAQLWLIGRSYAASPERRYYGQKINWTNSGNGLDTYFDLLAEELLKNRYDKLKEIATLLADNGAYQLTENPPEYDLNILTNVIDAVLSFNRLLKEAQFSVDNEDLIACGTNMETLKNNQRNMISFSSKFLHFHFPNTVFIFDSVTKGHFKGCGNPYEFTFCDNAGNKTSAVKIYKKDVTDLIKLLKLNTSEISDKEKEYVQHCVREYLLAKAIYKIDNSVFEDKFIPRQIDTYMLIANSDNYTKH